MTDTEIPNTLDDAGIYTFACNQCKTKKIRCDRLAPACSSCQKAGRPCEFPAFVPRPGPKPDASSAAAASKKRRRPRASVDSNTHPPSRRRARDQSPPSDAEEPELDSSVSALVHPSHDPRRPDPPQTDSVQDVHALAEALASLGISQQDYFMIVDTYFANMVAFSLFHRPTFHAKIAALPTALTIKPLLVAMLMVSSRYPMQLQSDYLTGLSLHQKWTWARRLTKYAIDECHQNCPPLELLQALLLVAWTAAYQGVRGCAWRLVGDCVRLCYEMELHHASDPSNQSPDWTRIEERRRAWWTTWELDVFASTIKRLPTAIDWASNAASLPMDDAAWFASTTPSQSCPLALDPARRWKDLDQCASQSGWAWFIVFNSYKWDTYLLSVAPQTLAPPDERAAAAADDDLGTAGLVSTRRQVLANALHCARAALPPHLSAQDRLLLFTPDSRALDAWRYSIELMSSVIRFMTCRLDLFPARTSASTTASGPTTHQATTPAARRLAWSTLTSTASAVASTLRNAAAHHVELVNPCLSNAIWWQGCAMQLRRVFAAGSKRARADAQLLASNFDVLRIAIARFVRAANVPASLLESLDSMEQRLAVLAARTGRKDGKRASMGAAAAPREESNRSRQSSSHALPQQEQQEQQQQQQQQQPVIATPELDTSLPSISPMLSEAGLLNRTDATLPLDNDPGGPLDDGSLDFLLNVDDGAWRFNQDDFFRCPFE